MSASSEGLTRENALAFLVSDGQRMESQLEAAHRRVRELEAENRGLRTDLRRAQQNARMLEKRVRMIEEAVQAGEMEGDESGNGPRAQGGGHPRS